MKATAAFIRLVTFVLLLSLSIGISGAQKPLDPPLAPGTSGPYVTPAVEESLKYTGTANVIVVFRTAKFIRDAGYTAEIAANASSVLGALPAGSFQLKATFSHIAAFSGTTNAAGFNALRANPLITHINLDDEMTLHDAEAEALTNSDDVNALGITGDGVIVTVIDSGVDTDHPALADDLLNQACFYDTCPTPGPGVGIAEDQMGHGTHVTGIITGATGVAPDVQFNMIKVFGAASTTSETNVVNGMNYVVSADGTLNTDIVNMSLGGGSYSTEAACDADNAAMKLAVDGMLALGIAIFISTGNGASTTGIGAPGCLTGVIGVGSVGDAVFTKFFSACTDNGAPDKVSCYSNATNVQGPGEVVDILAPGCDITSEWMGGGTDTICGTSMASPMTAGIGALMLETEPSLTPALLETLLEDTGDPILDYRIASSPVFPRVDALNAYGALTIEPPTGLMVTYINDNQNDLQWTDTAAETGYVIQRSADNLNWGDIGTNPANDTTFSDMATVCGLNYYRVLASDGGVNSTPSNVVSQMSRACPLAPSGLTVTRISDTELQLNWTDNAADETSYVVQRAVGSGAYSDLITLLADAVTHNDTALSCSLYNYRVKAVRGTDVSAYSNVASRNPCGPENDFYEFATPITAVPYNVSQTNVQYASVTGDPVFTCRVTGAGTGTNTVWYSVVPDADGFLTSITTDTSSGSYSDTILAVRTFDGATWTQVACDDDAGAGFQSLLTNVPVSAGVKYYIHVARWSSTPTTSAGTLVLNVTADVGVTIDPPGAFDLLTIGDTTPPGPVTVASTVTAFTWESASAAASYTFDLTKPDTSVDSVTLTNGAGGLACAAGTCTYTVDGATLLDQAGQYSWTVTASNVYGDTPAGDSPRYFEIVLPPDAFDLLAPGNDTPPGPQYVVTSDGTAQFTWDATDADTYDFELTRPDTSVFSGTLTPGAGGLACDATTCTYTVDVATALLEAGSYAWTVTANNSAGGTEASNAPYYFDVDIGTELIQNGGFEDGMNHWTVTNATSDKRRCNKPLVTVSYAGECAFVFKGSTVTGGLQGTINENSKLAQTVDISPVTLAIDDTLTLNAQVKAPGAAAAGKLIIQVKYSDATPKTKLKTNIVTSADYALSTSTHTLTTDAVSSVKVIVQHKSPTGKVYVDEVSLLHTNVANPRDVLPAPQAPSGFRGNN